MITSDFHTHSTFSDGNNTLAEMAEAALAQGMTALGFSEHGYAPYDSDCCMRQGTAADYIAQVRALADRCQGRLTLLAGVERDFYGPPNEADFDYTIGSVHYLLIDGQYYNVDYRVESLYAAAEALHGELLSVAECYFDTVAQVVEVTRCQLIGHFDLVAKLNRDHHLFDERHPRYVAAWQAAADRLLATGVPFEVNTGAISRGYRDCAYPSPDMLAYLAERGARFVLSSDSHCAENLRYGFPQQEESLAALGVQPWNEKFLAGLKK